MKIVIDWITEIDLVTEMFRKNFSDFTEAALNHRVKENAWSIAQNIEHINLLNSSYFEYFKEIQSGTHSLPETENLETKAQDSLVALKPFTSRERIKRANTWDIWQPTSGLIPKSILYDFEESQLVFKKLIKGFDGTALTKTFIKYPGHLDFILKLDDCIDLLIEHENRHLNQAVEIGRHS